MSDRRFDVSVFLLPLIVVLSAAGPQKGAAPADSAGAPDSVSAAVLAGWPATPEGEMAYGWVRAFSAGEEAMREFNAMSLSPGALERVPMAERLKNYRKFREKYGKLTLASVKKEAPGELTVSLLDADAKTHEFVFAVQTKPPHKLVSVSIKEHRMGHGHFGFGH